MNEPAERLPDARMALIDRQWAGHWASMLLTPIQAPSVADVRDLLCRFFEEMPTAALACRMDLTHGTHVRVPTAARGAFVERMVIAAADPDLDALDAYQYEHQAPQDWDLAARIVVGPSSLYVCFNHTAGDAMTHVTFLDAVAKLDADGLRRLEPRMSTAALTRAIVVQTRASGGRWLRAVRARRTAPLRPAAPEPLSGPRPPIPATPGQVTGVMDRHELAAMTAWGRVAHPTASMSSVMTSALYRALRAEDLPVDPAGFNTLINLRRYLPDGEQAVAGNLSKSLFVATDDLADPTAVSAAQRALLDSGWALPSTLVGALFAALPGRRHVGSPTVVVGEPITICTSILAALPGLPDMPWQAGSPPRFLGVGYPVGPNSVTLWAVRLDGHLELGMSYVREEILDETARRVLGRLRDVPALFVDSA